MNLIEQLGGYEVAINKFRHGYLPVDEFIRLEIELLEYRRQHNIFEVGDPVIRKWNNQLYWIISDIDNGSEFLIHKNKDAKFKDCKVCELHCNLSHATPQELEAGHRL